MAAISIACPSGSLTGNHNLGNISGTFSSPPKSTLSPFSIESEGFPQISQISITTKKKKKKFSFRTRNRFSFKLHSLNPSLDSSFSSSSSSSSSSSLEFDVVIVGAGIIGLTIARQFLLESNLSVAIVDAAVPCSGATGAGQGYIWMTHKTPGSEIWELAMRSKRLWEMLASSIRHQGMDPWEVLGWKKTGSLLIGRTPEEVAMLKARVKLLLEAGLRAEYLSFSDLLLKEPSLHIENGGAAFLPDDCQLDALRTVAFIEKGNKNFVSKRRYTEFYHDPAFRLLRSDESGEVEAVQTSKYTLYCKKAAVIAAGSWSGSLMQKLVEEANIQLDVPVKPRKGHLLVVENFNGIQLNHGLMEVGYTDHQVAAPHCTASDLSISEHEQTLSISMTATTDGMGNLVLGSSRQFAGFNTDVDESIIQRIWTRAGDFFPTLREVSLADITESRKVRVGLRPYMSDGKPIIGPVPGLPKVVLATGHEGGGLCMVPTTIQLVYGVGKLPICFGLSLDGILKLGIGKALGTAEMVADMVLGNTRKVDFAPFAVHGRCT